MDVPSDSLATPTEPPEATALPEISIQDLATQLNALTSTVEKNGGKFSDFKKESLRKWKGDSGQEPSQPVTAPAAKNDNGVIDPFAVFEVVEASKGLPESLSAKARDYLKGGMPIEMVMDLITTMKETIEAAGPSSVAAPAAAPHGAAPAASGKTQPGGTIFQDEIPAYIERVGRKEYERQKRADTLPEVIDRTR